MVELMKIFITLFQNNLLIIWMRHKKIGFAYCKMSITSLAICWRISIISEKSGLNVGSCCQHLSSNSASFGWVFFGMVGRRPWKCYQNVNYFHIIVISTSNESIGHGLYVYPEEINPTHLEEIRWLLMTWSILCAGWLPFGRLQRLLVMGSSTHMEAGKWNMNFCERNKSIKIIQI